MKRYILLGCVAAVAFGAGCRPSSDRAAVVNGEVITKDQFYRYMALKPTVRVIVDPSKLTAGSSQIPIQQYEGQIVGSFGLQALSDLIQRTVVMQLAKDDGVAPTDKQIKDELDDRRTTNPNFARELMNAGYSTDMIESTIALELAQINLTTEGITISDADVDKYIADHPNEFMSPAAVDLVWMLVPDDKKKDEADAALRQGESFINVALKYTADPNAKNNQAKYPVQNMAQLGNPLQGIVEKTPVLKQTDWLRTPQGWAKFYVNKKEPSRRIPITDNVKKQVKRTMALRQGMQGKDLNQRIQDRLKTSDVQISIEHLQQPWKDSMKSLQPNSGGPGSTTPTGG